MLKLITKCNTNTVIVGVSVTLWLSDLHLQLLLLGCSITVSQCNTNIVSGTLSDLLLLGYSVSR